MDQHMRWDILEFLADNNYIEVHKDEVKKTIPVSYESEDDIGITKNGLKYPKKFIMQYMAHNGHVINEDNVELVVRKFLNEGGFSFSETEETYYTMYDEATDEQLRDLLNLNIAKMLNEITNEVLYRDRQYNFAFDISAFSADNNGVFQLNEIADDMVQKKKNGYDVVNMFSQSANVESSGRAVGVGQAAPNQFTSAVRGVLYVIYEKRSRII